MSLYTGFLLSAAWVIPGGRWYVPLWDNTYLPVLFVLSGVSTGVAAAGLGTLLMGRFSGGAAQDPMEVAEVASLTDVAAIIVEAVWVYLFFTALSVGTNGQQLAYKLVTGSDLGPWFWWGFIATGLALPLAVSVLQTLAGWIFNARAKWILCFKFILVLAGGLMLRYVVVWGGDLKTPLVFPPSMWPVPGIGGPAIPGLGG